MFFPEKNEFVYGNLHSQPEFLVNFHCSKKVSRILAPSCILTHILLKVKDPSLVASLSGHTDGSRAFARYREIDMEMKRELVEMID